MDSRPLSSPTSSRSQRLDTERLYLVTRCIVRCVFVTVNNLYCIPVHFVWLLLFTPLKYAATNVYWFIEGILFRWLLSMVGMWSYSAGYHIVELGDDVWDLIDERTLVLFNHQSTADVPLIMAAFNSRKNLSNNVLWIMDHVFKLTNFGLVSWAHGDFFIKGGKNNRESSLLELKKHLKNFYLKRNRKWLILFPEGGFLKNRKATSQRYASKNNLPHLEHVTLPRTGAMKAILDTIGEHAESGGERGIKYVLDVTIAYPGGRPLDLQTIFGGWRPSCQTVFHYKKYTIDEIPVEDEALTTWAYDRYLEKEATLQEYYNTGIFPDVQTTHDPGYQGPPPRRLTGQQLVHDPIEFLVRHAFFILSTWLWGSVIYLGLWSLWQLL